MKNTTQLCPSWLNQKGDGVEINTAFEIIAIDDFFAQGEEATQIINDINALWTIYPELNNYEIVQLWASNNL